MSRTITVEGDIAAVDTLARLTAQGSVAAPSLVVPAGMTKIKSLILSFGSDQSAAGSAVFFVRLGGNAVLGGEQQIMIGGNGGTLPQAGSDTAPCRMMPFIIEDADIDVRASDTIDISAEMAGADIGEVTVGVTVVYGT
jgi:hypothetical protein